MLAPRTRLASLLLASQLAACSSWYRLRLEPGPVAPQAEPGPPLPLEVAVLPALEYLEGPTGSRGSSPSVWIPAEWVRDFADELDGADLFETVSVPSDSGAPARGTLLVRYYRPECEYTSASEVELLVSLLTLFLASPLFTYDCEIHVQGDATLLDGPRLVRSWSAKARGRLRHRLNADPAEYERSLVEALNEQIVERMRRDGEHLASALAAGGGREAR